ncbi:MAG: 5-(carboxyamino)imidazole ribonucleotide mutase [Kiritimatiellia bacterium]|jgi:5-(carboxyamino)imidazole ribonucleotide mutase
MKTYILYGSPNDKDFMNPGKEYFTANNIEFEELVLSVHRDTEELIAWLKAYNASGEKAVIIAVAGLSAGLPGFVAVKVDTPVIGVPVPCGPLNGVDALLAIVQCPGGVPLGSVGLHSKAPLNAAMFAHKILNMAL